MQDKRYSTFRRQNLFAISYILRQDKVKKDASECSLLAEKHLSLQLPSLNKPRDSNTLIVLAPFSRYLPPSYHGIHIQNTERELN